MFYHYDSLFQWDLLLSLADKGGLTNTPYAYNHRTYSNITMNTIIG